MIQASNLELAFSGQEIFKKISFLCNPGEKIGLVGRNGTGKSTLLKAITGLQSLDGGTVSIGRGFTVAYLPQEVTLDSNKNLFDEVLSVFPELSYAHEFVRDCDARGDHESAEYVEQHTVLAEEDYNTRSRELHKMLKGLGFSESQFDSPVQSFSVGWKMRIVLAKLLMQDADFYLFDEPTNHLDLQTKEWFFNFLRNCPAGYLLITHDRYFLDNASDKIFELAHGDLNEYYGNYSYYINEKQTRDEHHERSVKAQQRQIAEKKKVIDRFRSKASKAKMAQSMIKQLSKVDILKSRQTDKEVRFSFPPLERSGKIVLMGEELSQAYGEKQIFKDVNFEIQRGEKIALVAPNGMGKTTLFNTIAEKLAPKTGRVEPGYKVSMSLFEQEQARVLDPEKTVLQEAFSAAGDLSEGRVRAMLGAFLFSGDAVKKRTGVLSGGERNRLAMVKVLLQNTNCILLDEPTNHLDIQAKEIMLKALKTYEGTLFFVSHDRDFVSNLATAIFELTPHGLRRYPGSYKEFLREKKKQRKAAEEAEEKRGRAARVSNSNARLPGENQSLPRARSGGPAPSSTAQKKELTAKEQHERKKQVRSLENKIEKLEKQLAEAGVQLAEYEYGTPDFDRIHRLYQVSERELKRATAEWEKLHD